MNCLHIYSDALRWLELHELTCPSRKFLHLECPGCGLQRSLLAMLKGDFLQSLELYPALLPLIFLATYAVLHLKFKFRNGGRNIVWLQIGVVSIVMVHYIYKIVHQQILV